MDKVSLARERFERDDREAIDYIVSLIERIADKADTLYEPELREVVEPEIHRLLDTVSRLRGVSFDDLAVTRYDLDSGLYLGWVDGDNLIRIFSQDATREIGSFIPDPPFTADSIDGLLRFYINDPTKAYGEYAGLWERGA